MTDNEIISLTYKAFELETGRKADQIDIHKDLRSQVHLDSMQFVAIIARIETMLDIDMPIEAMMVETLDEFFQIVKAQIPAKKLIAP